MLPVRRRIVGLRLIRIVGSLTGGSSLQLRLAEFRLAELRLAELRLTELRFAKLEGRVHRHRIVKQSLGGDGSDHRRRLESRGRHRSRWVDHHGRHRRRSAHERRRRGQLRGRQRGGRRSGQHGGRGQRRRGGDDRGCDRRRARSHRASRRTLQLASLRSLEPGRSLGICGLHAKNATPGVRGFARVAEPFFPNASHLASQLGALRGIAAAENLILVELDHSAVIAELLEQARELRHHVVVRRAEVVELLVVDGSAGLVAQDIATQLRAARQELANEGAIEDLLEHTAERRFDARRIADASTELLEGVERRVVDVRRDGVAEPAETAVDVAQIAKRDGRSASQERSARSSSVARPTAPCGERVREARPKRDASTLRVASLRRDFERLDRLLLDTAAQREFEESARSLVGTALRGDLSRTRERGEPVCRCAASADLPLIQIDDVPRSVVEGSETMQQRLHLGRRYRGQRGLTVRDRAQGIDPDGEPDLGLAYELDGPRYTIQICRKNVLCERDRLEITNARSEGLELLREVGGGSARTDEIGRHAASRRFISRRKEPVERALQGIAPCRSRR